MAISNTPNTTEYMVTATTCYDQYGTEVPPSAYPTVTYQSSVWCYTCQAAFRHLHTCPKLNVDISKQAPTLSLETRVLQLEARILDQQDIIDQLADRIQALHQILETLESK